MNKANVVELPEIESHEMSQNDWFPSPTMAASRSRWTDSTD